MEQHTQYSRMLLAHLNNANAAVQRNTTADATTFNAQHKAWMVAYHYVQTCKINRR